MSLSQKLGYLGRTSQRRILLPDDAMMHFTQVRQILQKRSTCQSCPRLVCVIHNVRSAEEVFLSFTSQHNIGGQQLSLIKHL